MNFKIEKNNSKMGPFWKRAWYNLKSGVVTKGDIKRRCNVDFGECKKGVSIKLTGIAAVAPFSFTRLKYSNRTNSLKELFDVAHEHSDRIVCVNQGDTIDIFAYAYRNGRGLSSPKEHRLRHYDYMKYLGQVKQAEPFNVRITTFRKHTRYVFWKNSEFGHDRNVVRMGSGKNHFLHWIMTAHAAGAHGPVAPEDISLTIENL